MSERFDTLSRTMAAPMPRRRLVKVLGGAVAGGVVAVLVRPVRASANCPIACGSTCCENNTICVNPSASRCGCAAGNQRCGPGCCGPRQTCSDPQAACCCPSGATPCGPRCCKGGVACLDRTQGICGCPAGTTSCGGPSNLTCCPAGTACGGTCAGPTNNTVPGQCYVPSDARLKEHVVPIRWEPA